MVKEVKNEVLITKFTIAPSYSIPNSAYIFSKLEFLLFLGRI